MSRHIIEVAAFQRINDRVLLAIDNDLYLFDTETMQPVEHFVNFQNQPFSHFPIQLRTI